jgi:hypothetical protein
MLNCILHLEFPRISRSETTHFVCAGMAYALLLQVPVDLGAACALPLKGPSSHTNSAIALAAGFRLLL